jgi:hypothetical protein
LENVPANTTSYRAMGKLFIQSPLANVSTNIKESISKQQEEISRMEVCDNILFYPIIKIDFDDSLSFVMLFYYCICVFSDFIFFFFFFFSLLKH